MTLIVLSGSGLRLQEPKPISLALIVVSANCHQINVKCPLWERIRIGAPLVQLLDRHGTTEDQC